MATVCHGQSPLSAQDALRIAAKNRASLKAARLRIDQARSLAKAESAAPGTTFSLGASSRNDLGATDEDLAITHFIDLFGKYSPAKRLGGASIRQAYAEYLTSAAELQTEVLTVFANAVAAQHHEEVGNDLLKIAEGLLTASKRRFDEGKVAELQVVRASIEFERAKQNAASRASDSLAAKHRLMAVLGMQGQDVMISSDSVIPVAPKEQQMIPALETLRAEIAIAEAEVEVAKASNKPEFSVQALRSPWGVEPGAIVGRAQFTFFVNDNGKARNSEKAAKSRLEAAWKALEDTSKLLVAEMRATEIELESRQKKVASYEAILSAARTLVAKSQQGYSEGFGTQVDVLEANRSLREVEQETIEAKHQLALAVIANYKAIGYVAQVLK